MCLFRPSTLNWVPSLTALTQACNTEAQAFYKKFGFELKESVPDYYKKLAEPDAVILSKVLKAAAVAASA